MHLDRSPIIKIKAVEDSERVIVTFADNGIGFDSKKNADKIFQLNQNFHDHEDSKGVGLYLVYNHLKDMDGNISVKSEVNKGATFTITLKK